MAVYEQPQTTRRGFALLLLNRGKGLAFIKVRNDPDGAPLAHEGRVLSLIENAPTTLFWAPQLMALGTSHAINWLAVSPLPTSLHQPVRRAPLSAILSDIGRALGDLPRPSSIPAHWTPMHGDLTPWNLRALSDGRLVLLDWEDAGWGPPGADGVYFRATASALWGVEPPEADAESIDFWQKRVRDRPPETVDSVLQRGLMRALHAMRGDNRHPP